MKNFQRKNLLFSLCGLNCGLCPMYLGKYCPGCGGGPGNQPCKIAKCSLEHHGLEYCYECNEYPCQKYDGIDAFDSFITHRNQLKDFEKVKSIGMEKYQVELNEKMEILQYLLKSFNDGHRKNFFCIAVNLMNVEDIKYIIEEIEMKINFDDLSKKDKAVLIVNLFQSMAQKQNIILKLNKKTKNSIN